MATWTPTPYWASYPNTQRNAIWLAQRELDDARRLPTLAAEGLAAVRRAILVAPGLHPALAEPIRQHLDALSAMAWDRAFVAESTYDMLCDAIDALEDAQRDVADAMSDGERETAVQFLDHLDTAWRLAERVLDHVAAEAAIRRLHATASPIEEDPK